MRLTLLAVTALILAFAHSEARAASADVLVQGILVTASNDPKPSDDLIAPYIPSLKRVLRFESYQSAGSGSTRMTVPGATTVSLGQGHRLELESISASGNQIRLRVKWSDSKRDLMSTTLRLSRGVPAVLGGPPTGAGEVYAIIVLVL